MRDLTITLVQAEQVWENVQANLDHYESLLSKIDSTDLIVLPEMFQTAFSMNTSLAEKMDGPSVSWLKKTAYEKDCAIYTSLMISEGDTVYNRGIFVFPSGDFTVYDKRKTFGLAKESDHITAGTEEQIVSWKGWNIQLQICYDLRFPEISRNSILENGDTAYDLIIYVANWPEKRSSHWNALLKARAIENQCYVVGVNRVGSDDNGFAYSGDSKLINSLGIESPLPVGIEACDSHVINKDELNRIREMLPFLCDRS
ncbi:MAG: nitrilase family protein [Crocinitomicaceae bacterium]|nr:nitrilase family protein [Flavobacteriales bacterium]NQZ36350.1 nitrilase family protein [Crocinitomicaceae bacterium]